MNSTITYRAYDHMPFAIHLVGCEAHIGSPCDRAGLNLESSRTSTAYPVYARSRSLAVKTHHFNPFF